MVKIDESKLGGIDFHPTNFLISDKGVLKMKNVY